MNDLILGLLPAFVAGLAVQQLIELADPVSDKFLKDTNKKVVLNITAFCVGLALVLAGGLTVLTHIVENPPTGDSRDPAFKVADVLVAALIVSGGTETFNSVIKFLAHAKDEKKASADQAATLNATPRSEVRHKSSRDKGCRLEGATQ